MKAGQFQSSQCETEAKLAPMRVASAIRRVWPAGALRLVDRLAHRIVGHDRRLEILDCRFAAVGPTDALQPGRIAGTPGAVHGAPQVDSAATAAFRIVQVV